MTTDQELVAKRNQLRHEIKQLKLRMSRMNEHLRLAESGVMPPEIKPEDDPINWVPPFLRKENFMSTTESRPVQIDDESAELCAALRTINAESQIPIDENSYLDIGRLMHDAANHIEKLSRVITNMRKEETSAVHRH